MIVNLTPHPLVLQLPDGTHRLYESAGVARCNVTTRQLDRVDGIPVVEYAHGDVDGLPAPKRGVIYVVSAITGLGVRGRSDVYTPACPVKDQHGRRTQAFRALRPVNQ